MPPSADKLPLVTILCTVLATLFALNVAQTAVVLRVFHSGMNAHKAPVSQSIFSLLRFLENMGKRSFIYSKVYNPLHRTNFKHADELADMADDEKYNEFNAAYYLTQRDIATLIENPNGTKLDHGLCSNFFHDINDLVLRSFEICEAQLISAIQLSAIFDHFGNCFSFFKTFFFRIETVSEVAT